MNYLIAAIMAGLLMLGMFVYCRVVRHAFWQEAKNRAGEDLDSIEDYGMEVPSGVLVWMNLASFFTVFRIPLIILILIFSFCVAWYCDSAQPPVEQNFTEQQ
ncbi:hypothetical protein [Gimesia panareensis]|uniref:Uncharacterized protein n=1 Tax=Gimesia panareensis TaxID=2527978 RepID=A0A518ACW3_9PLAN|nr:hypothetical protein [Gimesia panareensis]QDT29490.1 hypothetical protein Enr10x_48450 [Gimesia panareensis]QDU52535.1 hypothetical protein Pan110_49150 [Gimesia panareensis]